MSPRGPGSGEAILALRELALRGRAAQRAVDGLIGPRESPQNAMGDPPRGRGTPDFGPLDPSAPIPYELTDAAYRVLELEAEVGRVSGLEYVLELEDDDDPPELEDDDEREGELEGQELPPWEDDDDELEEDDDDEWPWEEEGELELEDVRPASQALSDALGPDAGAEALRILPGAARAETRRRAEAGELEELEVSGRGARTYDQARGRP